MTLYFSNSSSSAAYNLQTGNSQVYDKHTSATTTTPMVTADSVADLNARVEVAIADAAAAAASEAAAKAKVIADAAMAEAARVSGAAEAAAAIYLKAEAAAAIYLRAEVDAAAASIKAAAVSIKAADAIEKANADKKTREFEAFKKQMVMKQNLPEEVSDAVVKIFAWMGIRKTRVYTWNEVSKCVSENRLVTGVFDLLIHATIVGIRMKYPKVNEV